MQSISVFKSGDGFAAVHVENPEGADKHYQFASLQEVFDLISKKLVPVAPEVPAPVVSVPEPVVPVAPEVGA